MNPDFYARRLFDIWHAQQLQALNLQSQYVTAFQQLQHPISSAFNFASQSNLVAQQSSTSLDTSETNDPVDVVGPTDFNRQVQERVLFTAPSIPIVSSIIVSQPLEHFKSILSQLSTTQSNLECVAESMKQTADEEEENHEVRKKRKYKKRLTEPPSYECPLCHKKFARGEKPFRCGKCDRSFNDKSNMRQHERKCRATPKREQSTQMDD
ncbi:hypothetical protein M3Y98_01020000 [Aphelenchoides besseyi]|nr:hypothetical protein M3Y98_01020000 [Aphelenchoides besseyi]